MRRSLPGLSLKARALAWLAQREQSRMELRRKLLRLVRAEATTALKVGDAEPLANAGLGDARLGDAGLGDAGFEDAMSADAGSADAVCADAKCADDKPADLPAAAGEPTADQRVDALLDWLEANRYLSPELFIESRVHARAARFGNLRIRQELKEHGLAMPAAAAEALKASELDRARAVRARKFDAPADTSAEQARHMRFLIGRGFSPEVVRRVMRETRDADD